MKKINVLFAMIFCSAALFAQVNKVDEESLVGESFLTEIIGLNGSVESYTRTDYEAVARFGKTYRRNPVKNVHVLDSSGRETELAVYDEDGALVSKEKSVYRSGSSEKSVSDGNGKIIKKYVTKYTTDSKVEEISVFNPFLDEDEGLLGKTIYTYGEKEGSNLERIVESVYGGEGYLRSRTITVNNGNGLPVTEDYYNADGSLIRKCKVSYDRSNRISRKDFYKPAVSQEKLSGYCLYRYDNASSALAEIQVYEADGTLCGRVIYTCDAKMNPTMISVYTVSNKFGENCTELLTQTVILYKYRASSSSRSSGAAAGSRKTEKAAPAPVVEPEPSEEPEEVVSEETVEEETEESEEEYYYDESDFGDVEK